MQTLQLYLQAQISRIITLNTLKNLCNSHKIRLTIFVLSIILQEYNKIEPQIIAFVTFHIFITRYRLY
jgi:hypothetical protein